MASPLRQVVFNKMNTRVSDTGMDDSDLRLLINAEYEKTGAIRKVKGYTQVGDVLSAIITQDFNSAAEWNQGAFSLTAVQGNSLVLQGSTIEQTVYNDFSIIYSSNWFSESFIAESSVLRKVALYLDKIIGASLNLYRDFSSLGAAFGTVDPTYFVTTSTVKENNGGIVGWYNVGGSAADASFFTDNKVNGDPILGFKVTVTSLPSGGISSGCFVELTNGTDSIRFTATNNIGGWRISTAGSYGNNSNLSTFSSELGTIEIKPDGTDMAIFFNSVEKARLTGVSAAANSYLYVFAKGSTHGGENYAGMPNNSGGIGLSNIYFYQSVTALTDLDIRIETDSAGFPSGVAIANGTATISPSIASSTAQLLEAIFLTPPTTSVGTTYWIVIKQTGGDSNNAYRLYKQNSAVYANGFAAYSINSGVAWAVDPDNPSDVAFIAYGAPATSGTWISPNITLAVGQTLSQLTVTARDLSASNYIDRIDILNSSNAIQSSYTTDITSGTNIVLFSTDFNNGFTFTNGSIFRIKVTLISAGAVTPIIDALILDSPSKEILELSPFYQSSGTKAFIAVVAGTVKRLTGAIWTTIRSGLVSGQKTGTVIFRASKSTVVTSGTATSGDLTSLTAALTPEPEPNRFQGKMLKIISGPGVGQVRVIESHDGTSTSTSTSTTTSSTTTTSTTTSTTRSTSTSTTHT